MENVGILTAFFFGFLSFISPCVLPIVPGYLSFISGVSFDEMNAGRKSEARKRILSHALAFVLGFSLVFIALGASATFVGQALREHLHIITKVAGAVIIVFGLHMTGIMKIPFLNYEKRFHSEGKPLTSLGAFIVGLAFAFGWTPCIGPILAAILTIASQKDNVGEGIVLLTFYSAGLGVPFLLAGASITMFYGLFGRLKRYMGIIEIVSGVLLIVLGVLIMLNYLTVIAGALLRWFPFLNELG